MNNNNNNNSSSNEGISYQFDTKKSTQSIQSIQSTVSKKQLKKSLFNVYKMKNFAYAFYIVAIFAFVMQAIEARPF